MKTSSSVLFFALLIGFMPVSKPVQAGEKVVLMEIFTNTGCVPCVPANQYFQNWLTGYDNKDRLAVVKYHVWWPQSNDPFYMAAATFVQTRRDYYEVWGVPYAYIDGFVQGQQSYTYWPELIDMRMDVISPFEISVTGNTSEVSNDIEITISSNGEDIPEGNLRLYIIIVETDIAYVGNNGAPYHYYVMRNMITGADGESFNIGPNEDKSFQKSFAWNSQWDFDNSKMVVFVQINETKEVLQAFMRPVSDISPLTSVQIPGDDIPSSYLLRQNYPNPFNPVTVIEYQLPKTGAVNLSVFNNLGQKVATIVDEVQPAGIYFVNFDSHNYPSGIYIYRIKTDEFTDTKKMILIR
jgi:hypothetical protein